MMDKQKQKLFAEFPPVTVADWEAKIIEDLKGADYNKKLIRKTLEDITIKPYYTAEDLKELKYTDQIPGRFPFVRGGKLTDNTWEIRQDFVAGDIETVIEKARLASTRGVTSVGYDLSKNEHIEYPDFKKLLSALDLPKTGVNFICGNSAPRILEFLIRALAEMKVNHNEFRGSLEFDPLGYMTVSGGFYQSEKEDLNIAGKLLKTACDEIPGLRILAVNSHSFSDTGATAVQELAFGLSMISEYLVALTDMKFSVADIRNHLQWNLGTGSDYFMEIAKVRAARLLFSGLMSGFDKAQALEAPVFIHCSTTNWNKTVFDPNINMLRLTTEAMAAILGGCNSLLVKPYDSCYNQPGDFSERLARNIQIILKEESHFDRVVDPASGSYYIESLTRALVENAWELFLKIDSKGGYIQSFTSGFITQEINSTVSKRMELAATRREILLGTNQYPNFSEKESCGINEAIAFPGISTNTKKIVDPVLQTRAAAEFEKLRLATEKHKGKCPSAFMLTYGNLAMRLARSQFSGNFFACAGYDIIDNLGFTSAKEGVEVALKMKADIIVVCSSDEEYTLIAPEVADLVKDKAIVVVAGAPACMEELKQKGIKEFIHMRSNVLETLRHFHAKLGITGN